jgi:hypothetical protein
MQGKLGPTQKFDWRSSTEYIIGQKDNIEKTLEINTVKKQMGFCKYHNEHVGTKYPFHQKDE